MISMMACLFCRCLLRSKAYLSLKPSQTAAAAFTLAVRVSKSPLVKELGFKHVENSKIDSLVLDSVVSIEMDGVR